MDIPPDPTSRGGRGSPPKAPRWVKVFAIIAVVVAALVVIVLLSGGGEHGPGRHMPGGGGRHSPPMQHG